MKKQFFIGALAVLSLAACSKNEVVDENRNGDEIRYSVVANKATKAADVYCNNNLPGEFYVWATHSSKTYISGDRIEKGTAGTTTTWTNKSGNRYWPAEGAVDFYAHVNAGENFKWNNGTPKIENFEVVTDVAAQKDLLYAVTMNQTKAENQPTGVNMSFRHALSQIVFKAKNTNPNLYVEIYGVTVCNLGNVNTYTYNATTTSLWTGHNDNNTADINRGAKGTWDTLTGGNTDYSIGWTTPFIVEGNQTEPTVVNLYTAHAEGKEFSTDAMLLLPQSTTKWDPEKETNAATTGTYFLVKCNIYNVSGDSYNEDTDVLLYGTADTGKNVAIPVAVDWKEGNKYIYTFTFGDGNGGYDPDDDPALYPINFTVTVDDFDLVLNQDVPMETNN